jgi:hypothetical protein
MPQTRVLRELERARRNSNDLDPTLSSKNMSKSSTKDTTDLQTIPDTTIYKAQESQENPCWSKLIKARGMTRVIEELMQTLLLHLL